MTIFTWENMLRAYENARKSRKKKYEVYVFDQSREERILNMLKGLQNKNYKHLGYKEIIINDSKKRYIFSPQFRDHIFHHLIYEQIYNCIDTKLVHSTFACRRGYGNHRATKYLQKIIKKELKNTSGKEVFYLKIDFSKCFFSINHDILKEKLRRIIFDEEILYCLDLIIGIMEKNVWLKRLKLTM